MAQQMTCDCGKKFLADATGQGVARCPACRGVATDDALVAFPCPGCGHAMKARASYAGRTTRCLKCDASVTVPAPEARRSPTAKKPSAGRLVAIGIGLLLLVGGVALAWWLTREKGDIDDFALVPQNTQGVVCVKVDALWRTPAVQKMAENYRRANPGKPDLARRMETETGLKPEEIERVTLVVTNAASEEGWAIVRTKNPYDSEAIRERVRSREIDPTIDEPFVPLAFEAVSPRVFVLGKDAGVRRALDLLRVPVTTQGPLGPVLERCREADHVVFGYNPAADRGRDGRLAGFLRGFEGADMFIGTLNVRERVELEVHARTDAGEKAERLHGLLERQLPMARTGLGFAAFLPGNQGKVAVIAGKLLRSLKLRVEDKEVVATSSVDADPLLAQLLGVIP